MAILVKKIKKRDTDMLTQNTRYHKSTLTDNETRSIVVRRNCINQNTCLYISIYPWQFPKTFPQDIFQMKVIGPFKFRKITKIIIF